MPPPAPYPAMLPRMTLPLMIGPPHPQEDAPAGGGARVAGDGVAGDLRRAAEDGDAGAGLLVVQFITLPTMLLPLIRGAPPSTHNPALVAAGGASWAITLPEIAGDALSTAMPPPADGAVS